MDIDTRRALSEQIRIGDELRRKMNSIRGNMQDDEEDDDDDENNLIDKARQILHETEEDEEKPANGLFKMAFMQRGLQLQRDRYVLRIKRNPSRIILPNYHIMQWA
jgi:U3 small nucleolar RNA-associated protein 14